MKAWQSLLRPMVEATHRGVDPVSLGSVRETIAGVDYSRPEVFSAARCGLRRAVRSRRCASMLAAVLVACTPSLDWREVQAGGLTALFPCKPKQLTRGVTLQGRLVPMTQWSCTADGASYSVMHADLPASAAVEAALDAWRGLLVANIVGASASAGEPLRVPGMSPGIGGQRLGMRGRLADGAAVEAHAAYFARGGRLFQAVVLGAHPSREAVDTFFGGFRLPT